jgi:hypothetical protein
MIVLKLTNAGASPMITCDVCNRVIDDASAALYAWQDIWDEAGSEHRDVRHISHVHKGECWYNTFRDAVDWQAITLDDLLLGLVHNTHADLKQARVNQLRGPYGTPRLFGLSSSGDTMRVTR